MVISESVSSSNRPVHVGNGPTRKIGSGGKLKPWSACCCQAASGSSAPQRTQLSGAQAAHLRQQGRRTVVEVDAKEIAASFTYATATVSEVARGAGTIHRRATPPLPQRHRRVPGTLTGQRRHRRSGPREVANCPLASECRGCSGSGAGRFCPQHTDGSQRCAAHEPAK
jgi:hypothetical protein